MDDAESGAMAPAFPHTADWIGAVGAIFPFFFSYRPGGVPDWVAIAGGFVALVAGAFTVSLLKRTPPALRTPRIVATIALLTIGSLQLVLRGFGLI
ncbi:hypothetical protein [Sandaracinus amylolyticus]|nr:hypothetical protein [Sandaracinus amylolyticus]